MDNRLEEVVRRFERITADLARPDTIADAAVFRDRARERAALEPIVDAYLSAKAIAAEIQGHVGLLDGSDAELASLAREELPDLRRRFTIANEAIDLLLLPKDPNDDNNVIVEIRAAAGGDEAALFAEALVQMYLRYALRRGWNAEIADATQGNQGGLKDAALSLKGTGAFAALKWESGVHRVQRVPATEAQGRIHTSTVTVAVLPEVEEAQVQLAESDIELQVMRSTGAGGQSVNTTDSAVRLIHKPSGIVVKCQQEKSQTKNRAMAMKMLRAKLYALEQERIRGERDALRRGHIGSGDRSEKIRTYNFPQDRLTDHRIGFSRHALDAAMAGDLDDVLTALQTHFRAEALKTARL